MYKWRLRTCLYFHFYRYLVPSIYPTHHQRVIILGHGLAQASIVLDRSGINGVKVPVGWLGGGVAIRNIWQANTAIVGRGAYDGTTGGWYPY